MLTVGASTLRAAGPAQPFPPEGRWPPSRPCQARDFKSPQLPSLSLIWEGEAARLQGFLRPRRRTTCPPAALPALPRRSPPTPPVRLFRLLILCLGSLLRKNVDFHGQRFQNFLKAFVHGVLYILVEGMAACGAVAPVSGRFSPPPRAGGSGDPSLRPEAWAPGGGCPAALSSSLTQALPGLPLQKGSDVPSGPHLACGDQGGRAGWAGRGGKGAEALGPTLGCVAQPFPDQLPETPGQTPLPRLTSPGPQGCLGFSAGTPQSQC